MVGSGVGNSMLAKCITHTPVKRGIKPSGFLALPETHAGDQTRDHANAAFTVTPGEVRVGSPTFHATCAPRRKHSHMAVTKVFINGTCHNRDTTKETSNNMRSSQHAAEDSAE